MRRSFKFRLRPTCKQVQALETMLADHRELYNAALQERRDAYRKRGITVSYGMQSAQLKDIRKELAEQARWSFSSQQATLRRLNLAMQAFFRRVKAGQTPGSPRFKGARWFDTVVWPSDGDGCRWDSTSDKTATRVYLQGVGHVRVHRHRQVAGTVKTISVKREGSAWYVVLSCDDVPANPLPPTGNATGIDVGVTEFAALADGTLIGNPGWWKQAEDQLTQAQRAHSLRYPKTAPRSARKTRSAQQVAKVHRALARKRLDFHHKLALDLVRGFDTLCHEALNIAGMVRAPKPKPDPDTPGVFLPNQAAAKAGLNKRILDAAWAQFLTILAAKAENAGRLTVAVNARHSSQTCHECRYVDPASRNGIVFRCTRCGYEDHADVNAARNHLRAGLVLIQAASQDGSPRL
ncbi:MAG TPA: transposase [Micromonosporaceae bacterium]|nr:transposase [Micromonosporaceae bacterium]HCU49314.1 transposase [Micromonosporaceae bacterium]